MLKEKFEKLFAQREDLLLDDEDKGTITDKLSKYPEIWRVDKKYLYNKINFLTRKLATCNKEELEKYQFGIKILGEVITDQEMIKKDYLKKSLKPSTVGRVKDFFYYVTSQDVKDKDGKVKLTAK